MTFEMAYAFAVGVIALFGFGVAAGGLYIYRGHQRDMADARRPAQSATRNALQSSG